MDYLVAAQTDIGISKKTNQDSYCIKVAKTKSHGDVLMAVVCDGMGGLAMGEIASATVVKAFSDWFSNSLPNYLDNDIIINYEFIQGEWTRMIRLLNAKIGNYGLDKGVNLGTTLVVTLCIDDKIYVGNVGDSRVYKISDKIYRLTRDQSLVAQEISLGKIKPEEEESDSRRNVLLQCVGASKIVNPEILEYKVEKDTLYLLCTDGFRHEISEQELQGLLSPSLVDNEESLNSILRDIINLLKSRQENDNITGISFKVL